MQFGWPSRNLRISELFFNKLSISGLPLPKSVAPQQIDIRVKLFAIPIKSVFVRNRQHLPMEMCPWNNLSEGLSEHFLAGLDLHTSCVIVSA